MAHAGLGTSCAVSLVLTKEALKVDEEIEARER